MFELIIDFNGDPLLDEVQKAINGEILSEIFKAANPSWHLIERSVDELNDEILNEWLKDNCREQWKMFHSTVLFESLEDATAYKLKWY